MDYTRIFICIAIMALVTYLPRMLPLTIFRKKIQNRFIHSFLHYVPYAVLAAMTFPEILYSTENLISGAIGMAVAVALAFWGRGLADKKKLTNACKRCIINLKLIGE